MSRLGETLHDRRQALGISLDEVERSIRVRRRLLEALEAGEYERLPNPGYVRGYISSYARLLELDPVALLNMYKAETGGAHGNDLQRLPQRQEAVVPTGQQHVIRWRVSVTAIAVIVGVGLIVWWALGMRTSKSEPTILPEPAPATAPTTEQTSPANSAAPTKTAPPTPEDLTPTKPFVLKVMVAGNSASWFRITIDGDVAYEGVLSGGQAKTYDVAESAIVLVGKPEAATVLKDGKKVAIKDSGDLGKVELSAALAK